MSIANFSKHTQVAIIANQDARAWIESDDLAKKQSLMVHANMQTNSYRKEFNRTINKHLEREKKREEKALAAKNKEE